MDSCGMGISEARLGVRSQQGCSSRRSRARGSLHGVAIVPAYQTRSTVFVGLMLYAMPTPGSASVALVRRRVPSSPHPCIIRETLVLQSFNGPPYGRRHQYYRHLS